MHSTEPSRPLRTAVIGLGQMGHSHALAYHHNRDFTIVGLHDQNLGQLPAELAGYPMLPSFEALLALEPDVVAVCTYTSTHARYAIQAMEAGAHVFVEKPLASSLDEAQAVIDAAARTSRKLVIGYILRHHPSWTTFIEKSREVGPPYVMRLNLNQQSSGKAWNIHKRLMQTTSPLVDCGVHYVDVMCQITDAKPVQVRGMGLRLTNEVDDAQVNYGHLQVVFEDGSLGWYEAGWGPMFSETAYFVKDVIGPRGAVSIVLDTDAESADVNTHTKTGNVRLHWGELTPQGQLARADEWISMAEEPGHYELCAREQRYLADAIRHDLDLTRHHQDALRSLAIVFAAERSRREMRAIDL